MRTDNFSFSKTRKHDYITENTNTNNCNVRPHTNFFGTMNHFVPHANISEQLRSQGDPASPTESLHFRRHRRAFKSIVVIPTRSTSKVLLTVLCIDISCFVWFLVHSLPLEAASNGWISEWMPHDVSHLWSVMFPLHTADLLRLG